MPSRILRAFLRHHRILLWSMATAVTVTALLMSCTGWRWTSSVLTGWNCGALLYLGLIWRMMLQASHAQMQARAQAEDESQGTILLLTLLAGLMCLAAIVADLASVKTLAGSGKLAGIGLALLTIASSWLFTHTIFALHYAHLFYVARAHGQPEGLVFPGEERPDYLDFAYFAFIIGTSAQTADVSFSSRAMRRTGLMHCMVAFVFNTTLLALMINMAASLI